MESIHNILFMIILFSAGSSSIENQNCANRQRCNELFGIKPLQESETVKIVKQVFNLSDVDYPRLVQLFEKCEIYNYSYIKIDCSRYSYLDVALYAIYLHPSEPSVLELHGRTGKSDLIRPKGLENVLVGRNSKDIHPRQQLQNQIDEVPATADKYQGFQTFNGIAESAPKWLKLTNTVLQSISIALLALTAALTCIQRSDDPVFRCLHFVLSLSLAGVLSCHLIWFLDVPVTVAHLLLSIAEHYLWLVSCLATLTLNAKCCTAKNQKSRKPPLSQQNFHNTVADSLADQYLIIFVIPILYMAPLPFIECFAIHKYQHFKMVALLTHIYMEGHNSVHTILEFVCPFLLIMLINLITTVIKILRGLSRRNIITTLLLLLVSITLPILYASMVMSKSPNGSLLWHIMILVLTILLTVAMIATFLVDLTFPDYLISKIDRRKSSYGSSVLGARRRLKNDKDYEFPSSGPTRRRT